MVRAGQGATRLAARPYATTKDELPATEGPPGLGRGGAQTPSPPRGADGQTTLPRPSTPPHGAANTQVSFSKNSGMERHFLPLNAAEREVISGFFPPTRESGKRRP